MKASNKNLTKNDLQHLNHCLALAQKALEAGDEPFGSILVNAENQIIAKARNRVNERNILAHPEFELAHWAAEHLSAEERRQTTMYTSGEHCPMCAAAHGWVGIGKLIYLSSGTQLNTWLKEFGVSPSPIRFMPVEKIIKKIEVKGPAMGKLLEGIKDLHQIYHQKDN